MGLGAAQAIELSADILANVKFIQEKKLIGKYFDEISQDTGARPRHPYTRCRAPRRHRTAPPCGCPLLTPCVCFISTLPVCTPRAPHPLGKYCFGVEDTLSCLDMGAVETLLVWENLEITRHTLLNPVTGATIVKHLTPEQEKDTSNFIDKENGGTELEPQDKIALLEWFANEYKRFGCSLEFVTNKSQEGSQFCRGFGGIGGILRYQVDRRQFEVDSDVDGGEFYSDDD